MKICYALALCISLMCSFASAQNIVNEPFNVGIPGTWPIVNGGGPVDTWFGTTNGLAGNTLNGSQFAFVNSDAAGNAPHPLLSEQLITPTFNGTLYAQIILEFDQFFRVFSTDRGYVEVWNGTSWVTVLTMSATAGAWNAPNHPTLNITPYSNAAMKVRFRYEDNNVWAWWWAVDNVRIYAPPANEAQLTGITLPSRQCGLTTTESITVAGRNNGTVAITSLPLRYRINGGATVSETMTTAVAPNATFSYTFASPANMVAAGQYRVDAWASLPGDATLANDSILGNTTKNHIVVSSFPYIEDYETSQGGWFVTGTAPSWAWGTPAKATIQGASSGTKAWVTGGLGTTSYANNENNRVEGPCLDFTNTGAPWVGLDTWWNSEFSWDGANLQTSIDSGLTWQNVGQLGDPDNWYTDDAIDGNPGGSTEGWSGRNATGSGGWVRSVHSLAYLAGEADVLVRINFASDASVVDDGFAFDNFNVARQPNMYLGPDIAACDSATLDAGLAAAYDWSNGDSTQTSTVYQSGTYTATVRDSFGFPATDVIAVTIDGPRTWDLGNDTILCAANSFAIAAGPGAASYQWSNNATTAQVIANTSGLYAVTATSSIGCQRSDSIMLTFSDLSAAVNLLAGPVCRGIPTSFMDMSAGSPTSWFWDFGNGNLSTNQNPTTVYTAGGTFILNLEVSDGLCIDDTSFSVLVEVCVGADAQIISPLSAYPTPANEQIYLLGLEAVDPALDVQLVDVAGRTLQSIPLPQGTKPAIFPLATSSLADGIYVLHVWGDAIQWQQKIIVAH